MTKLLFCVAWMLGWVTFRQWVIDAWPWTEPEIGRSSFAFLVAVSGLALHRRATTGET